MNVTLREIVEKKLKTLFKIMAFFAFLFMILFIYLIYILAVTDIKNPLTSYEYADITDIHKNLIGTPIYFNATISDDTKEKDGYAIKYSDKEGPEIFVNYDDKVIKIASGYKNDCFHEMCIGECNDGCYVGDDVTIFGRIVGVDDDDHIEIWAEMITNMSYFRYMKQLIFRENFDKIIPIFIILLTIIFILLIIAFKYVNIKNQLKENL